MNLKNYVLPLLGLTALLLNAVAADTSNPRQVRSGIVEYELSTSGMGTTQKGTKTEWFDDYGNRTATLEKSTSTTKILGQTSTEVKEELTIIDGDTVYTIDLRAKTGTKADIGQMKQMGAAMANRMGAAEDPKKFVEKNGGKWLPAETFLGRKCDVVEMMGVKTWTYKGVTLKTEGAMMGIATTQVAKKFEENVRVPASKFQVPAGIEFETQEMPAEAAAMMQALMGGGGQGEDGEAPNWLAQAMQQAQAENGDDEEDSESDWPDLRLPLEDFRAIVADFTVPGYRKMPILHTKKEYGLILANNSGSAIAVGVTPEEAVQGRDEDPNYKLVSKFKHAGYSCELIEVADEGDEMDGEPVGPVEISSGVVIHMPRKGCVLVVTSKPKRSKAEMMKLLEMLDL